MGNKQIFFNETYIIIQWDVLLTTASSVMIFLESCIPFPPRFSCFVGILQEIPRFHILLTF